MALISFVTFLWNTGFREYTAEHVNLWAAALDYWYRKPHRNICITNEAGDFAPNVEVMPLPRAASEMASIPAPQGDRFPSSYRRLWLFSRQAQALGERVMLLDVDIAMLGDPTPLLEVDADFVGWRPRSIWGRERRIGGGTWLLRTGTHTWLWEKFRRNPARHILEAREAGWNGSDQAILSSWLLGCKVWPQHCGIYGSQDGVYQWSVPPKDAIVVHFNGDQKLWNGRSLWMRAYCNHFGRTHATLQGKEGANAQGILGQCPGGDAGGQAAEAGGGDRILAGAQVQA